MSEHWRVGGDFKRRRFGKTLTICWNYKREFFHQQVGFGICARSDCAWPNGDIWIVLTFTLFLSSPDLSLFLTFLFLPSSPFFQTWNPRVIFDSFFTSTLSEPLHLLNVTYVLLLASVSFLVLLSLLLFRSYFLLLNLIQ